MTPNRSPGLTWTSLTYWAKTNKMVGHATGIHV